VSIKSKLIAFHAARTAAKTISDSKNAIANQNYWLQKLIKKGAKTVFGKDHNFHLIKDARNFAEQVPIRTYEDLNKYTELLIKGEANILWPGKPKYFAKTSGTTSGIKYIPITHASIKSQINTASRAVLNYVHLTKSDIFDGNLIFISGSPTLTEKAGIKTGRLSGIVNHEIPSWIKSNQLPSYSTNCIEPWEEKLDQIVEETYNQDLRLISGIPPWVQMYYEKLLAKTGKKTIKEIFPKLRLFVYGGVNYEPYRNSFSLLHGTELTSLETYPASEGFIAYQNDYTDPGLLLNTNAGLYFEFVPLKEISKENPTRLTLKEVELDKDYVLILSSNAGLWAYNLGDTIRFTSLAPYKIKVSGRVKHFISAFGEHVIAKEVEEAMAVVSQRHGLVINEFTIAPQVNPPEGGLPYHEWFIEFDQEPDKLERIAFDLDEELARQNIYYHDLLSGNILQTLKIRVVKVGDFRRYMAAQGRLGGQNKVPRLMNDRGFVDGLGMN